jgi:hypothetical protein
MLTTLQIATICAHIATGFPAPNYDLIVNFKADHETVLCDATEERYGSMNLEWTVPMLDYLLTNELHRVVLEGETDQD